MSSYFEDFHNFVFAGHSLEYIGSNIHTQSWFEQNEDIKKCAVNSLQRICVEHVKRTDEQIKEGLNFIINPSYSDTIFLFFSKEISQQEFEAFLTSIKKVYVNVFEKRCKRELSHLIYQENGSVLNSVCYMMWDVMPCGISISPETDTWMKDAILKLLSEVLDLDNIACKESGLQGLKNLYSFYPEDVDKILASKLSRLPRELAIYAKEGQ